VYVENDMAESGTLAEQREKRPHPQSQLTEAPAHSGPFLWACAIIESAADRSSRTAVQGALIGSIPGGVAGIVVALLGAMLRGTMTDYVVIAAFSVLVIGLGGAILGAVAGALLGWMYGIVAGAGAAFLAADSWKARLADSPAGIVQAEHPARQEELLGRPTGEVALAMAELACSNQEML
jgi:hypothetical protein